MPGADFERGFADERRERLRCLVARDAMDAFIHRPHDDARRARRGEADGQAFAGPHADGCVERDGELTAIIRHAERRDAGAERTGENFRRVERAHERDIHIRAALDAFGHGDVLHARCGVAAEPLHGEHTVALDRDEARAGVRRAQRDFELLAGLPRFVGQRDFQLRVALKIARGFARAHDRERHCAEHRARGVAPLVAEAAGSVHGQIHGRRGCGQRSVGGLYFLVHFAGDVGERAVLFLGEHRGMARLDEHAFQRGRCGGLCIRADGDELKRARHIARDEVEITRGLETDEEWLTRDERAERAADSASAVRLECLQVHGDAQQRRGVSVERKRELCAAFLVGLHFAEFDFALLEALVLWQSECPSRPLLEMRHAGRNAHLRGDTAIRGGDTEERLHLGVCREFFRREPCGLHGGFELRGELEAVGLELLHAHKHVTDVQCVGLAVLVVVALLSFAVIGASQLDAPHAGRRCLARGQLHFEKAVGRQFRREASGFLLLRICEHDLDRQARERALPVALAHDGGELDRIAGAVDSALGEECAIERGSLAGADSGDVEAREFDRAIFARPGDEREVCALARDERDRRPFTQQRVECRERCAALRGGVGLGERVAIFCERGDVNARYWRAILERLHEDFARAVCVALHDEAEVGDEHEARIPADATAVLRGLVLLVPVVTAVALLAAQADPFGIGVAVVWLRVLRGAAADACDFEIKKATLRVLAARLGACERGCEIERRVVCLVVGFLRDGLHGGVEVREIFKREIAEKSGRLKAAVRLRDEVVDLRTGDARQRVAQVRKTARLDAQLALAVQREDAAATEDARALVECGHVDDDREILAREEAAGRGRFLRHADEEPRGLLRDEAEAEEIRDGRRAIRRDGFECDALGFFEHGIGDAFGFPGLLLAVLVLRRRREMPRLRGLCDDSGVRGDAALEEDKLPRLAVRIRHELRARAVEEECGVA